ncbi:copper-binding protein [Streptomyces sp. NPDC086766]|uniref:copper-binding protein n=1 Tax=Streptomyces sp. NPDC086766 TaxID=3365754 RepID=UPI0038238BE1
MARRSSRGGTAAGAGAVALGAVLAACGGPGAGGVGAGPDPAPGGGGAAAGTTVTVRMTEYRLALSTTTFRPGAYTFVAENDGHTLHSLEIEGRGGDAHLAHGVEPGRSARLRITLKDGSYELYCPVDGHKGFGMKTEITVGGGGVARGESSRAGREAGH